MIAATARDGAIRLRAHHLLCLLTFAGKGYSPTFVANLRAIAQRIRGGTPVTLVAGPDDICAALGVDAAAAHCIGDSVRSRDALARSALNGIAGLTPALDDGTPLALDAPLVRDLRARFAAGDIRAACVGCEWSPLCTEIARAQFAAAEL